MSKVVIQGDASGTGNFTIAAPNSNTDRTLTLPDEAGTVLTSVSSLAGANLSNNSITSAKLTGDAVPIGAGQTWQNVTRTSGVTYYNTTGRTICFSVNFSGANTFQLSVSTAGHLFLQGSSSTYKSLSVLIPSGEQYTPTYSFTLYNMLELR
jgi:hypothetical protein